MKLKSILICKQSQQSKTDKLYKDVHIDLNETGQLCIMEHSGHGIIDTLCECHIDIIAANIIKGRAMEQVDAKHGLPIYEPRIIYMWPMDYAPSAVAPPDARKG